jgi:hypothetical protein
LFKKEYYLVKILKIYNEVKLLLLTSFISKFIFFIKIQFF